jgi:pimeloyl-ACP methyl ester carboxylesterase
MAASSAQLIPFPQRRRVDRAEGVALALEVWAEGGRPVLFAHGFGQTRGAWAESARRLAAAGYQPWTLDARGHGDSDRNPPSRGYRMDEFIDDLQAVAESLPARPVLVGASMGGLLGIAAQARGGCFDALVLVDITPRWDAGGVARILDFMGAHPHGFASLEAAADAIAAYLPHRPRKSAAALQAVLRQGGDGRWRWHWDPRLLNDIGRAGDAAQQAQLAEAARRITVPTLLVSGGRSDLIGDEHVAHFLELVPHARHQRIADATHMVAGDRNDVFTDAILGFLASTTLVSAAPTAAAVPGA